MNNYKDTMCGVLRPTDSNLASCLYQLKRNRCTSTCVRGALWYILRVIRSLTRCCYIRVFTVKAKSNRCALVLTCVILNWLKHLRLGPTVYTAGLLHEQHGLSLRWCQPRLYSKAIWFRFSCITISISVLGPIKCVQLRFYKDLLTINHLSRAIRFPQCYSCLLYTSRCV